MTQIDPTQLEILGPDRADLIRTLSAAASKIGQRMFLIGGSVRDLLLQRPVTDIDLMIDGKLPEFLALCKAEWGTLFPGEPPLSGVTSFDHYFTAKLRFDPPFRMCKQIDLSQARKESYPNPGQKPVVEAGTLETDVKRRDFTVNSLALEFSQKNATLIDLCGGEADLQAQLLRVHHDKSFTDDPIRLVRLIRFLCRFGFKVEDKTHELFEAAAAGQTLLGVPLQRRFEEFRKVLLEKGPNSILLELDAFGLIPLLCPVANPENIAKLAVLPPNWEDRMRVLVSGTPRADLVRYLEDVQASKVIREQILK